MSVKRYEHGDSCSGEYRCEPRETEDGEFVYHEDYERLEKALQLLARRVSDYRMAHDFEGDGALATGRAWDLMRRALLTAKEVLEGKED